MSGNPETGLFEAALLASNGYLREANTHIEATDQIYRAHKDRFTGILARHDFDAEISHMKRKIQEDLKQRP